MDKITIAIIKKNRCEFNKMIDFAPPLLYKTHLVSDFKEINKKLNDYIWSIMEQYITFIEINSSDLLEVACESILNDFPDKQYDNFQYITEGSYATPECYLEFIYALPLCKSYINSQMHNINNIGCLLSLKHNVVENSCIVISNKYDIRSKNFVTLQSITKNDIIEVIRKRYFHTAVLIEHDKVREFYYQNPALLVSTVFGLDLEKDSIKLLRFSHLKYNLVYYFLDNDKKYSNSVATRINGNNKMHGNVLVLSELEENIYSDITISEIKNINLLSYGRYSNREVTEKEYQNQHNVDSDDISKLDLEKKTDLIFSKYIITKNRLLVRNNNCICCNKYIEKKVICQTCFRPMYCSKECCDIDYNNFHYKECIDNRVSNGNGV